MNVYAGPVRALTRITLRLVPLTPVHVGDGTEMRLDEYLFETPRREARRSDEYGEEIEEEAPQGPPLLCRFDPARAMRAMQPLQRSAFQQALDAGKLDEAARLLRKAGKGAIVERIPISGRSAAELQAAFENPLRRSGHVKPFVRSGGRPYIPGSSLKGAFRTALASAALPRGTRQDDAWSHETALQAAFGLNPGDTATDPLRFLHVSDAFLPEGATLIDRVEVMDSKNPRAGKMQMHYERTHALVEREDAPVFTVALDFDARAGAPETMSRSEARFDPPLLLSRCRAFHDTLFDAETQRFFDGASRQLLLRKLREHRSPDGRLPLTNNAWDPDFLFLRLGRFGHFESKSLEGVRRGHFPQARNPADKIRKPNAWGLTRTVTRDANKNPIPFGWVIGWVVKEERG
ncbi:MAG: RAMP superfamily CRISPR-associated protein [Roseococcus sp.]